jgi:MFS family permease
VLILTLSRSVRSVLVLIASSIAVFCSVGFLNAFGTFQAYYKLQYLPHLSNFQISWIGSFSVFMAFSCAPFSGFLSDKFGPSVPIGIAAICQLVAIFTISLCREYYQFFLAQGMLLGFGFSLISIPATSVSPLYFQRNRGLAQGVIISGSSLGGVIWPIVLDQLLKRDEISFGWSMRIVGFIQMPLLALVFVGVRRPRTVNPQKEESSERTTEMKSRPKSKELSSLRHPSFILLCGGLAVFYFGFFTPLFYVTTYAISLGTSESLSTYLIAILNAASFFGRILPGYVADRVGHFNIMVYAMLGSGIVSFCWTAVNSVAGLIVWSLAYGFVSGVSLLLHEVIASTLTMSRLC